MWFAQEVKVNGELSEAAQVSASPEAPLVMIRPDRDGLNSDMSAE